MFSYKANAICMAGMAMSAGASVATSHNWNRVQNPDSSLIMHDFDLTDELSLKIELHMLRPITEKVHSGNGRVSLVRRDMACITEIAQSRMGINVYFIGPTSYGTVLFDSLNHAWS